MGWQRPVLDRLDEFPHRRRTAGAEAIRQAAGRRTARPRRHGTSPAVGVEAGEALSAQSGIGDRDWKTGRSIGISACDQAPDQYGRRIATRNVLSATVGQGPAAISSASARWHRRGRARANMSRKQRKTRLACRRHHQAAGIDEHERRKGKSIRRGRPGEDARVIGPTRADKSRSRVPTLPRCELRWAHTAAGELRRPGSGCDRPRTIIALCARVCTIARRRTGSGSRVRRIRAAAARCPARAPRVHQLGAGAFDKPTRGPTARGSTPRIRPLVPVGVAHAHPPRSIN